MTLKIDTVVSDIYDLVDRGLPDDFPEEKVKSLGLAIANVIASRMKRESRKGTLRMSNIGTPCDRKLYYSVNSPELAEELAPEVRIKFLFGDILEELLLFFVEASGHDVRGRQDTLTIEDIDGHRDAVIDGTTTDVKSASSFSFDKFESHSLTKDDPFGYEDQLQSYIHAGQDDPIVTDKGRGAFLVIDKTLGKICLDVHERKEFPYEALYRAKKRMVAGTEIPDRGFEPVPDGKSGNEKLGTYCSYCDYKNSCHPSLRTFLYSSGPRFLTTVKREPDVPELRREETKS